MTGLLLLIGAPIALFAVLLFFGGQVSTVLSTIGSSVDGGRNVGSGVGGDTTGSGDSTPAKGSGPVGTTTDILDVSRTDLLIIKTGTMDLQVRSVAAAVTETGSRMTAIGGYVSGTLQTGEGDAVRASATYRIPAARWEDALAAARAVGLKVLAEKTQTNDVTGQVVDLGARIANLQATERALQQIMDRATKISDVLSIQGELTKVRGDIETATAAKQHLTEQAAYSTLTVGFGLQPKPAVVVSQQRYDPKSEVDRASATLVDILQGLETAGIWFAIVWLPILVVLTILGLVVAVVGLRIRVWFNGSSGGPEPPPPPLDAATPLAG